MAKIPPILGVVPSKSLGVLLDAVSVHLGALVEIFLLYVDSSVSATGDCSLLTSAIGDWSFSAEGVTSDILWK